MRVLDSPRYFGNQLDAFARFVAQSRSGFLQASASRILHAEKWQPVFAVADLVDGKNVRMIKAGGCFSFAPKTFPRLARVSVIRHHSFEGDDPARVPLARAINLAHSTASDLLQDFVIANPPVSVEHFVFGEDRFERFARCLAISIERLAQRAAQAKSISQTCRRSAFATAG